MSISDKYFIEAANKIINDNINDNNLKVRPKWSDGTPAHTIKTFCYVTRYDVSKEYPLLTLRKQAFKNMVRETLWIWQKKSNNIKDLGSHIWDSWADEKGTIGKAYGYQLAKKYEFPEGISDQVDHLIYDLKHNSQSRRIMTNIYNFSDLKDMHLYPCAFETIWDVSNGKLNMTLVQRSGDMLAAAAPGGWNCGQYILLMRMIAQVTNLIPGEFVHIVNNLHIYDRHVELVKKIMKNPIYPAPKLWINPEVKNFYDFKEEDFKLEDYQATKLEDTIEIAV